jgi:hypothetical protein
MRRLAPLAVFLIAACGSTGIAAHTIALAYKAGDTYKYTLHAGFKYTIGAQGVTIPFDLDVSAKETMTVKSVDATGTADVSIAVTDGSTRMTLNGTTTSTTTTSSSSVEMKIGPDGRIVSINGSTFGNDSLPGLTGSQGGLVTAILPDKPVKPGDTWSKTYDQPNPFGAGTINATSNNRYLRDEKVGSVNTAVVESKINSTFNMTVDLSSMAGQSGTPLFPTGGATGLQGITVTGTGVTDITSWIDGSAHRVVKTRSTGTLDATLALNVAAGSTAVPGLSGPISFKGTQTLDMIPV